MLAGMIEVQPSMRCREPTHPVPAPGTNPKATLALQAQISATPSRRSGAIVLSRVGCQLERGCRICICRGTLHLSELRTPRLLGSRVMHLYIFCFSPALRAGAVVGEDA